MKRFEVVAVLLKRFFRRLRRRTLSAFCLEVKPVIRIIVYLCTGAYDVGVL